MREVPRPVVAVTSLENTFRSQWLLKPAGETILYPRPVAMTCSTFSSLQVDPKPLVSLNFELPSRTHTAIIMSGFFNVHILNDDESGALIAEHLRKGNSPQPSETQVTDQDPWIPSPGPLGMGALRGLEDLGVKVLGQNKWLAEWHTDLEAAHLNARSRGLWNWIKSDHPRQGLTTAVKKIKPRPQWESHNGTEEHFSGVRRTVPMLSGNGVKYVLKCRFLTHVVTFGSAAVLIGKVEEIMDGNSAGEGPALVYAQRAYRRLHHEKIPTPSVLSTSTARSGD
ncbi:hypothetical protein GGR56DRAFT_656363 [Xylariaceae sp. FL0804]|nr:hypothetical protein GGR56DRAFT_656363 [Xylariaceae sp. FL0804]